MEVRFKSTTPDFKSFNQHIYFGSNGGYFLKWFIDLIMLLLLSNLV